MPYEVIVSRTDAERALAEVEGRYAYVVDGKDESLHFPCRDQADANLLALRIFNVTGSRKGSVRVKGPGSERAL